MKFPFDSIYFGLIFLLLLAIGNIIQAQRKKEKTFYLFAAVALLMALAFVSIIINLPQLVVFLMITVLFLSIIGLLKLFKIGKRTWAGPSQETDISDPLRARDILTMKGWLKLASRWGVKKTVFLYILIAMPSSVIILSLWETSITYVVIYSITFCIVSAVIVYQRIAAEDTSEQPR